MIYSNRCAWAIQAMTRLSMLQPRGYMLVRELCEGTPLPLHFVAKILQELARRGLLHSAKGRGGGFALARTPDKIKLLDIVAATDGMDQFDQCVVGCAQCDDYQPCPQHEQWMPIRDGIRQFLEETTLQQLSDTLREKMILIQAGAGADSDEV